MSTQLDLGLGSIDGEEFATAQTKISGSIKHLYGQPARRFRHGERVTLVVVADVDIGVAWSELGPVRLQSFAATEVFEITDEALRDELVVAERETVRGIVDERMGVSSLPAAEAS